MGEVGVPRSRGGVGELGAGAGQAWGERCSAERREGQQRGGESGRHSSSFALPASTHPQTFWELPRIRPWPAPPCRALPGFLLKPL